MIKVKAPPSSLEGAILQGIEDVQASNIKFHNIAFCCESIEDYEGRVFVRRKTGKWIKEREEWFTDYPYKCTNCGKYSRARYHFCPNCGADMRGEQE